MARNGWIQSFSIGNAEFTLVVPGLQQVPISYHSILTSHSHRILRRAPCNGTRALSLVCCPVMSLGHQRGDVASSLHLKSRPFHKAARHLAAGILSRRVFSPSGSFDTSRSEPRKPPLNCYTGEV